MTAILLGAWKPSTPIVTITAGVGDSNTDECLLLFTSHALLFYVYQGALLADLRLPAMYIALFFNICWLSHQYFSHVSSLPEQPRPRLCTVPLLYLQCVDTSVDATFSPRLLTIKAPRTKRWV